MVKNVTSTKEVKMLRDFSKSNKDYISKNKIPLICVSIFLIVGIVLWAVLGLNGNFEFKGYNEFSIKAGADTSSYSEVCDKVEDVVNAYGANYDGFQILGEGDNTELIIRYTSNLTNEEKAKVNSELVETLTISAENISEHVFVKPVVSTLDYVYTMSAILLLVVIASIFAYNRYNGASALTIILSCLIGSLGFISINAILRLSIGMSFFAMLVILNTIITYFAFNIFESMKKSNWLGNNDYATALKSSIQDTKFRISIFSIAIMVIGVLFVVAAPLTLKYISLNIMFMSVVVLATAWSVIPFIWSVLITSSRKKEYKVKATNEDTNK